MGEQVVTDQGAARLRISQSGPPAAALSFPISLLTSSIPGNLTMVSSGIVGLETEGVVDTATSPGVFCSHACSGNNTAVSLGMLLLGPSETFHCATCHAVSTHIFNILRRDAGS